jgi:hypothetical protein
MQPVNASDEVYPAPLLSEVIDLLPSRVRGRYRLQIRKCPDGEFSIMYVDENGWVMDDKVFSENITEISGMMLLYLKKSGLLPGRGRG